MADMLFKCPACSRHLIGNAAVIGTVIACTDCRQQIFVPKAGIWFTCPKCRAELAAPSGLAGEPFHCPGCAAEVVVPRQSTTSAPSGKSTLQADLLFECASCGRHLAVEAANVGAVVACKACKQQMIIPKPGITFKCKGCQRDLVAPLTLAGKVFDCPQCAGAFVVPQPGTAAPEAGGSPAPRADLLFKCSACSSPLFTDAAGVGTIVACTTCKQSVIAPKPGITFKCPKCLRELVAPPNVGGEARECPRCGGQLVVPPAPLRLPQRWTGKI